MPTTNIARPSGRNSYIVKAGKLFPPAIELTKIFIEVPIKVQTPQSIEANEIDISSFEAMILVSLETPKVFGKKISITGVLLINAGSKI